MLGQTSQCSHHAPDENASGPLRLQTGKSLAGRSVMKIDGTIYEFTRASDLERDGMSLECERVDPDGTRTLLLEAFWHDPTGHFSLRPWGDALPFALVQAFVRAAAEACPPNLSTEVGSKVLVHVKLLDESVAVWRPVAAEVAGEAVYRITGDPSDDEQWEFGTGTLVHCENHRFDDGTEGLVATKCAD